MSPRCLFISVSYSSSVSLSAISFCFPAQSLLLSLLVLPSPFLFYPILPFSYSNLFSPFLFSSFISSFSFYPFLFSPFLFLPLFFFLYFFPFFFLPFLFLSFFFLPFFILAFFFLPLFFSLPFFSFFAFSLSVFLLFSLLPLSLYRQLLLCPIPLFNVFGTFYFVYSSLLINSSDFLVSYSCSFSHLCFLFIMVFYG
jgi:hypothetical protein